MGSSRTGLSGEKGVALLLVVSVVSLLTVIILQFNKNMRFNLDEAWSFREREQLSSIAESGIDLAIAVLHTDSYVNDYDSLHDSWAKVGEIPIKGFDRGAELTITISDLSGRFQLNSMVAGVAAGGGQDSDTNLSPDQAREIFLRLLLSGAFAIENEMQATEIVDSIVDWMDSDDKESTFGAEEGYYESLDPPYSPRNNFMELPNELLAVKGITSELLYGNDEKKGLADYITVYGVSGAININTADPLLIQAFDDRVDPEKAALLAEFRKDEDNAELLGEQSWYRTVSGWPGDIELSNKLAVTTSSFFKIRAEASLGSEVLSMDAYLKRSGKEKMEILYRKIN